MKRGRHEGQRVFRVPGKLMIAGEYSVLGPGGEALAIAVDPGLEVVATPASRWQLLRQESGLEWTEGQPAPHELSFACAALTAARELLLGPLPPHRLTLRILGEMGTGRSKPGVGGSASVSVLVAVAVHALAGVDLPACLDTVLKLALNSHRAIQQGMGSGYDVATVTHGGVVRWQPPFTAQRLTWPGTLQVVAGYSGQSASTSQFLGRLKSVEQQEPERAAAELRALGRPVKGLTRAFVDADVPAILAAVRECQQALGSWAGRLHLGVITAAVSRMIEQAELLGAAAKVSGAGGGDSVIALSEDPEILARVARAWREDGFQPLALTLARQGARECSLLEAER